jgi:hypothetical protein
MLHRAIFYVILIDFGSSRRFGEEMCGGGTVQFMETTTVSKATKK